MLNKNELTELCISYDLPPEARDFFSDAADKVFADPLAVSEYKRALRSITHCHGDFSLVEPHLDTVASLTGLNRHAVDMLFRLLTTDDVFKIYKEAGVPDDIISDTISSNIITELEENRRVNGDWGTFVLWFHTRLYEKKLFKLGRLQFETLDGSDELNCHIISFLPFSMEAVNDSLKRAYSFFGFEEKKKPMKINMESWMLHPAFKELLSDDSNIKRFGDMFTVTESIDTDSELWYIFWKPEGTPFDEFPCETGLQKRCLEYLKSGKKLGEGMGYLIYSPA